LVGEGDQELEHQELMLSLKREVLGLRAERLSFEKKNKQLWTVAMTWFG